MMVVVATNLYTARLCRGIALLLLTLPQLSAHMIVTQSE